MKSKSIGSIVVASLSVLIGTDVAAENGAQDKWALKALDGVAFSEFRGYDGWRDVAVSRTDTGIKAILANSVMIKAYKDGIPGNGKQFPEGSMIVKVEWTKAPNPASPYTVEVPETLKSLSFIEKDSKRFPDSSGWGYAQFLYDAPSDKFTPYGTDSSFGTKICYQCHTAVSAKDYIFTGYPMR
jgi:hypothetical protein